MTRGWKIALAIAVAVVALNVVLFALRSLTGGTPGGPVSSSYATGRDGSAAYATLLARYGHRVVRLRTRPSKATLLFTDTVVLLDPPFVERDDVDALRTFVLGGGQLVVAPRGERWLHRLLPSGPVWDGEAGVPRARPIAAVPELAGVAQVVTAGAGAWRALHSALPVLGDSRRAVAAVAVAGSGRAVLLADSSLLQNRYLDRADNAAFAVAAAGAAQRRVVFLESYHGYGRGSGVAAIPHRWWIAIALAAVAALVFIAARARRFGPPEADARDLPPPRVEYVNALATTLVRTRDRGSALEPLRRELRRRIAARSGLSPDADESQLASAAVRLGLAPDEVAALNGPVGHDDELPLGRALARTADRGGSVWMS